MNHVSGTRYRFRLIPLRGIRHSPLLFLCFSFIFASPILLVLAGWFINEAEFFHYVTGNGLLAEYAANSFLIACSTLFFSLLIAAPLAWCVTMYEFPGRRFLQWALVMPLAIPSYITALIYGYLLESAGPVQYGLRDFFAVEFGEYWFPSIRSPGGTVFVLTVTLYPYMFLLLRSAFMMQSWQMLETARLLGCPGERLFWRLALPMARPALVAGAALIMMEALADYGVASLYGVPVLTTGIYRAWQQFYDPYSAARIATLLLVAILGLLWLEKRSRGYAGYQNTTALYHPLERWHFSRITSYIVTSFALLLLTVSFIIPVLFLLYWAGTNLPDIYAAETLRAAGYSFTIASATALVALMMGTATAYAMRSPAPSLATKSAVRLATAGYALPGSVIAVGVLLGFILLQNCFFGGQMLLTGTILGIIWGCALRFTTISFQSMESGLKRITSGIDEAAIMLGASSHTRFWRVHLPMLKGAALAGFMLVFMDTIKELPATLLLRPFNVTTLSIRVYELALDDRLTAVAPLALWLILLGIIPVWYLNRRFTSSRPGGKFS